MVVSTQNLFAQSGRLFPYAPYLTRRSVQILRREWIRSIISLGDNWLLKSGKYNRGGGNVLRNEFRAG